MDSQISENTTDKYTYDDPERIDNGKGKKLEPQRRRQSLVSDGQASSLKARPSCLFFIRIGKTRGSPSTTTQHSRAALGIKHNHPRDQAQTKRDIFKFFRNIIISSSTRRSSQRNGTHDPNYPLEKQSSNGSSDHLLAKPRFKSLSFDSVGNMILRRALPRGNSQKRSQVVEPFLPLEMPPSYSEEALYGHGQDSPIHETYLHSLEPSYTITRNRNEAARASSLVISLSPNYEQSSELQPISRPSHMTERHEHARDSPTPDAYSPSLWSGRFVGDNFAARASSESMASPANSKRNLPLTPVTRPSNVGANTSIPSLSPSANTSLFLNLGDKFAVRTSSETTASPASSKRSLPLTPVSQPVNARGLATSTSMSSLLSSAHSLTSWGSSTPTLECTSSNTSIYTTSHPSSSCTAPGKMDKDVVLYSAVILELLQKVVQVLEKQYTANDQIKNLLSPSILFNYVDVDDCRKWMDGILASDVYR